MVSVNARLAVFAPDGQRRGVLTKPVSWSASFPFNDVSALQLTYPRAADDISLLDGPCEIAVEVGTPSGWIEPRGGRYRLVEASANMAQGKADQMNYTCPGYVGLLDGIVVLPVKYGNPDRFDDSGKRVFKAASPGDVLATVRAEAATVVDNLAPGLEFTFTTSADSLGRAWSKAVTLALEPGLGLGQILQNLTEQGQCDWWMEGRKLFVVNPDSGTDRKIRIDSGAAEYPIRSTIAGLVHTGFLVGEENTWRVDNPGTPAPWGNSMKVLTQGGVKDEATARQLVQVELDKGSRERIEYQWSGNLLGAGFVPFQDFQPGDRINARNKTGKFELMRITQITVSFGDDGLTCGLMFNDRFLDAEVRTARRLKGITNGATGDAGVGTTPSRVWGSRPYPVEGLVVTPSGYWDSNGMAAGKVDLGWLPVTKDERGIALDLDRYRVNVDGKIVETTSTTASVSGLIVGREVPVSIVAIDRNGVTSAPVETSVKIPMPAEQLDKPSQLTVNQATGLIEVTWDGMLVSGAGTSYLPPKHFDHIVVREKIDTGQWRDVGTLAGAGTLTLARSNITGKVLQYVAYAVDTAWARGDDGIPIQVVGTAQLADRLEAARQEMAGLENNFQDLEQWVDSDQYKDVLYKDLIQAKLLAAEKIITKEMLADGAVTARTLNVVAPETTGGLSLDAGGMDIISKTGEYQSVASFRADSPNFIQFIKGDRTTFLVTPDGTLNAENLNALGTLTIDGKNVLELVEENMAGRLLGYAKMNISQALYVYKEQGETRLVQLTLTMPENDRALRLVLTTDAYQNLKSWSKIRWAKRSYVDSADPELYPIFGHAAATPYYLTRSVEVTIPSMFEAFVGVAPGENFTVAYFHVPYEGSSTLMWLDTNLAAYDAGPAVQLQLSSPYAPAGGSRPQLGQLTDRPLQTFKQVFPASWHRIYSSSGSPLGNVEYAFEGGILRGFNSVSYAEQIVVGLDSEAIQAFTSGAVFVQLNVFAEGFGKAQYQLGSMATSARWNVHGYSAPPSSYRPATSPVYAGPWIPDGVNRVKWGALFAGMKAGTIKGLSIQNQTSSGGSMYGTRLNVNRVWVEITVQK